MTNENEREFALGYALHILRSRAKYWEKQATKEKAGMYAFGASGSYRSAVEILEYALKGNMVNLRQYDE